MFLKLCREGRLSVKQKNMISICLSIVMDLRTDDCKYVRPLSIIDEGFNLLTFLEYVFLLNFSIKRFVFLFCISISKSKFNFFCIFYSFYFFSIYQTTIISISCRILSLFVFVFLLFFSLFRLLLYNYYFF